MEKNDAILGVVAHLRQRLGTAAFDLIDVWPESAGTIGVARPGDVEPRVCIMSTDRAGRFDVEHQGKVYPDCLLPGVEWCVHDQLRRHS